MSDEEKKAMAEADQYFRSRIFGSVDPQDPPRHMATILGKPYNEEMLANYEAKKRAKFMTTRKQWLGCWLAGVGVGISVGAASHSAAWGLAAWACANYIGCLAIVVAGRLR